MRGSMLLVFLFLYSCIGFAQYNFKGQLAENVGSKTVYLSVVEDYRKLSRPYLEQIIKKTTVDSLSQFTFKGDNLSADNRIYRIHVDECDIHGSKAAHFFGRCENSRSILFIANNRDTINFPTSFADEIFCNLSATNTVSNAFLEIDALKEEMAFDFYEFRSEANRKLNSKKWFSKLQEFGQQLNEPLAELYIYDFLSDKRNQTYNFYLRDISSTNYYKELAARLEEKYPNTTFTNQYQTEISTDQQIVSYTKKTPAYWKWILGSLLAISILINGYLIRSRKSDLKKQKEKAIGSLTAQEERIINEILKDKTNKEIASELFISLSTVKTHINNLYKKLNASTREELKERFS